MEIGITNCQKFAEEEVFPQCNEDSVFQIWCDVDMHNEVNITKSADINAIENIPTVNLEKNEPLNAIEDNRTMTHTTRKIREKNV